MRLRGQHYQLAFPSFQKCFSRQFFSFKMFALFFQKCIWYRTAFLYFQIARMQTGSFQFWTWMGATRYEFAGMPIFGITVCLITFFSYGVPLETMQKCVFSLFGENMFLLCLNRPPFLPYEPAFKLARFGLLYRNRGYDTNYIRNSGW